MSESGINKQHLTIGVISMLVIFAVIFFFVVKPESSGIKAEEKRLADLESKLIEFLAQKDTAMVKALLIQMRWQYEPTSGGGQSKTDTYRKIWRNKREDYLILIGEDPEQYQFDDSRPGFKEQWKEFIGN